MAEEKTTSVKCPNKQCDDIGHLFLTEKKLEC